MNKMTSTEYFNASERHDRKDGYVAVIERLKDPALRKEVIESLIESLEVSLKLDLLKRRLVYGDTSETEKYLLKERTYSELMEKLKLHKCEDFHFDSELMARLTHYTMGISTEGGELIENLLDFSLNGTLNATNAREERGDLFWFISQHSRACNSHIEADMMSNENKLGGVRYKNGYSDQAALNRDTDAELKNLKSEENNETNKN